MKVLFLDVDGVLNTRPGSLDEDKLELLRHIQIQTGAKIVLSSDWRLHPLMLERIIHSLWQRHMEIHGMTPCLDEEILAWGLIQRAKRSAEITLWLDANSQAADPVTSYAIVDDMPYADDGSGRFVQTHQEYGLTQAVAEDLIAILNSTEQAA